MAFARRGVRPADDLREIVEGMYPRVFARKRRQHDGDHTVPVERSRAPLRRGPHADCFSLLVDSHTPFRPETRGLHRDDRPLVPNDRRATGNVTGHLPRSLMSMPWTPSIDRISPASQIPPLPTT